MHTTTATYLLPLEAIRVKRDNTSERYNEKKHTIFTKFFKEWPLEHMGVKREQDSREQASKLQQLRTKALMNPVSSRRVRRAQHLNNPVMLRLNDTMAANLLLEADRHNTAA